MVHGNGGMICTTQLILIELAHLKLRMRSGGIRTSESLAAAVPLSYVPCVD